MITFVNSETLYLTTYIRYQVVKESIKATVFSEHWGHFLRDLLEQLNDRCKPKESIRRAWNWITIDWRRIVRWRTQPRPVVAATDADGTAKRSVRRCGGDMARVLASRGGGRKEGSDVRGGRPPLKGVARGVAEARGVGGGSQGKRASMPQNVDRERRVPHPFIQIHIHTQTYRFLVDDPSQVDRAAQHVEVVAGWSLAVDDFRTCNDVRSRSARATEAADRARRIIAGKLLVSWSRVIR